jgi:hypothetical protein
MFVNSTLCQIVKSRNPHCYFPILPTSLLPNCEVYIVPSSIFLFANFHFCQIARSKLPNSEVSIVKCAFSSCGLHITILLFCQITKSTSPFGLPKSDFLTQLGEWPNELASCPSLIFLLNLGPKSDILAQLGEWPNELASCTSLIFLLNLGPKSDILAQLGEWPNELASCPSLIFLLNLGKVHNELPSLPLYSVTLRCDVEMVFCFLLDKLTQHPYGVEAWHLLLLLS